MAYYSLYSLLKSILIKYFTFIHFSVLWLQQNGCYGLATIYCPMHFTCDRSILGDWLKVKPSWASPCFSVAFRIALIS